MLRQRIAVIYIVITVVVTEDSFGASFYRNLFGKRAGVIYLDGMVLVTGIVILLVVGKKSQGVIKPVAKGVVVKLLVRRVAVFIRKK